MVPKHRTLGKRFREEKDGRESRACKLRDLEKKVSTWVTWKLSSETRNTAWNLYKADCNVKGI